MDMMDYLLIIRVKYKKTVIWITIQISFLSSYMCYETVDNYTHVYEFAPNCYKTQKTCNRAVHT